MSDEAGKENMTIPEVPKGEPVQKESPISEWSFRQVQSRENKLLALLEKAQTLEGVERINKEIAELASRRENLATELKGVGGFDGLNERLAALRAMAAEGDLRARDIRDELNFAKIISDDEDGSSPYAGLREWYYTGRLGDLLREVVGKQKISPRERGAGIEPLVKVPESAAPTASQELDALSQAVREAEQKGDIGKLGELRQKLEETIKSLAEGPGALSGMAGAEKPPSIEELGEKRFREWFENRLVLLEEEYPDQSFETNWRLVYPLEQALNSLMPKLVKGEYQEPYKELRRELTLELESRRTRHNYTYIHRRVSGVGDLIGASSLLATPHIEHLLHKPEVAAAFRDLEILAEERGKKTGKTEKENIEKEINEKITDGGWAYLIASGLFSATGEAARFDIQLNGSGDFFLARIFNASDRAKITWEKQLGRSVYQELYEALDLKMENFWERLLGKARQEWQTYGINYEGGELSLKEAKFEELSFETLSAARDELKRYLLDAADADAVRKAIFDPGELLTGMRLGQLQRMEGIIKHLKGEEKYQWVREMVKVIIDFWKDRSAPWLEENYPMAFRRSLSKAVFPQASPLTYPEIERRVRALPPLIRKEDVEWLLLETMGSRSKRGTIKAGREAGNVLLAMAKGFGEYVLTTILGGKGK